MHGRERGRTIGFPTANLACETECIPPTALRYPRHPGRRRVSVDHQHRDASDVCGECAIDSRRTSSTSRVTSTGCESSSSWSRESAPSRSSTAPTRSRRRSRSTSKGCAKFSPRRSRQRIFRSVISRSDCRRLGELQHEAIGLAPMLEDEPRAIVFGMTQRARCPGKFESRLLDVLDQKILVDAMKRRRLRVAGARLAAVIDDPEMRRALPTTADWPWDSLRWPRLHSPQLPKTELSKQVALVRPLIVQAFNRNERMCLAIPGKVVETYREHDVLMGKVDFGGVFKRVCLDHTPRRAAGAVRDRPRRLRPAMWSTRRKPSRSLLSWRA